MFSLEIGIIDVKKVNVQYVYHFVFIIICHSIHLCSLRIIELQSTAAIGAGMHRYWI